ncbi:hypothetical protein CGLO_06849 [Colletotrichum gloeosporioides Cg-14]|uniref:Uncharacterized protein n=1 Tax=Colletotrichum gloeosporioides (strain Cg-14) TaxID=1237896 RepID=T0KD91_COLGC|nr:hypothetical protein CGLO_06849 [Colletotrichum gloeosporioides Cg-14]
MQKDDTPAAFFGSPSSLYTDLRSRPSSIPQEMLKMDMSEKVVSPSVLKECDWDIIIKNCNAMHGWYTDPQTHQIKMAPKPAFALKQGLNISQPGESPAGAIPNYCVNDGTKIDVIDVEEGVRESMVQNSFSKSSVDAKVNGGYSKVSIGMSANTLLQIQKGQAKENMESTKTLVGQYKATACNPQLQCPLFSTLPGEIRNEIFALALVQSEDSEKAYPEDSYWYRPGFSGPRKSSSALLQTCKAAYFEGQKAFLRELEWAFWFDRGPEGRTGMDSCLSFFRKLTPQQSQDLKKVRFFMQMFRFENGTELHRLFHQPNFNPEKLTITIRYSDWWYWESDTPLRMKEDWLRRFSGPPGLRELKVEYETITRKKDAMMKIVERNKKWKLSVGDSEGGHLSAEGTKLVEWRWHGKSALGGTKWYHHGEGDTMEYVVVTDTWRYVPGPMSEEDLKKREILPPEHYPAQDSDDSDGSDEEEEDDDADYSEYEIEDEDL